MDYILLKKKWWKFFSVFFFIANSIQLQPISPSNFIYKYKNVMHDNGIWWDKLSTISSNRYDYSENNVENINFLNKGFRIVLDKNNTVFNLFGNLLLKNNLYIYYNSDLYSNVNLSGFGFHNNWVALQIGKGREVWGAGNDINLALSDNANPYNYFMLSSDYGKIRVNYIHGFLENKDGKSNRYINARGIEWTNKSSLVIGLSETIIYSGNNRPMDFGYLNPLSTHLEIELNNRLSTIGDSSSNAVWQLHIDWLVKKQSRISINYLIDEFVFDPNIEIGKEHGKAFSLKLISLLKPFNLYYSFIFVGTPTFRHGNGTNNFINDKNPLGWQYGSDGTQTCVGLIYLKRNNMIFDFSYNIIDIGDESIAKRPYEPYSDFLKGKFPSGRVSHIKLIKSEMQIKLKSNLMIGFMGKYFLKINSQRIESFLTVSLNF